MIHAMDRMQVEAYPKRDDRAVVPPSSTGQRAHLSLGGDDLPAERVAREADEPRRGDDEKPVAVMGELGRIGVEEIRAALEAPDARPVMTELAKEVLRVAAKEGVAPLGFNGFDPAAFGPEGDPGAVDASFAVMVAHNRRSAKTHSGVWRDLAVRKRKTEIDAQFGPILELAAKHAVAVHRLERLVRSMREVEEGRRERAWSNLADLTPGRRRSAPTAGRA